MKKFYFLILLMHSLFTVFSQMPILNYTTNDYGKEYESTVWSLTQDNRGILYFGTGNGILEFDGEHWNFIFVKQGMWVTSLAFDSNGRIYVGGTGEFGYLEADNIGKFQYVSLSEIIKPSNEFSRVLKIHVIDNDIYFQSHEYIFVFRDQEYKVLKPKTKFHLSFAVGSEFYVRQSAIGLFRYNNDSKLELLPNGELFSNEGVFMISGSPNSDDNIMCFTNQSGIIEFNTKTGNAILHAEYDNILDGLRVIGGLVLENDEYALISEGQGLIILDMNFNILNIIDQSKGLNMNDIKCAMLDIHKNIVLGLNNGISIIDYASPIKIYSKKNGITETVYSVKVFQNKIYLGTTTGFLTQNDDGQNLNFKPVKGLESAVWDITVCGKELLIGTQEGLFSLIDDQISKINDFSVRDMYYDEQLNILFITGEFGIALFRRSDRWQFIKYIDELFEEVIKIEKDPAARVDGKDLYWLGMQNGIISMELKSDFTYKLSYYDSDFSLPVGAVLPFRLDTMMIFSTNSGFQRYIDEEEMRLLLDDSLKNDPKFHRGYFDLVNLPFNSLDVIAIFAHHNKNLFLYELNRDLYLLKDGNNLIIKPFKSVDLGKIYSANCDDGIIWYCGEGGLAKFDLKSKKDFETPFKTSIRTVYLANDSMIYGGSYRGQKLGTYHGNLNSNVQHESQKPVLKYKNNSMVFEFASPNYLGQDKVQYSYILEGFNDEWTNWSNDHKAIFTNLYEGVYKFRVKAKNVYGNVSTEDSFEFRISPPIYRTTTAYFIYSLFVFVFVFVAIKLGQIRLKRKNERLENLVQVRTMEIVQQKEEIKLQRDKIEEEKKKSDLLLLNTLPAKVVDELKEKGRADPENFENVTIFFSDIIDFTQHSSRLEPSKLIDELNDIFTQYDDIMANHHCERIKTIGDAYMAVCGMPESDENHAGNMMNAAIEIMNYMHKRNKGSDVIWTIRVGLHSGKCVGGIIGVRKYIYDVFGDTINIASRMESNSAPMKINVSDITYQVLKNDYKFIERDSIEVKGKGKMKMYFVDY